jgi:CheY-like chemotaxis protein
MPRILVVDDEEPNRAALERIFLREGWSVTLAADGREALEKIRAERVRGEDIRVLLTDVKMPGMNGLDLLRAAKQLAPRGAGDPDDRLRHGRDRGRSNERGRL